MPEITVQTVNGPVTFEIVGAGITGDPARTPHDIRDTKFSGASGSSPTGKHLLLLGAVRYDSEVLGSLKCRSDGALIASVRGEAEGDAVPVAFPDGEPQDVNITSSVPLQATLAAGTQEIGSVTDAGPTGTTTRLHATGDLSTGNHWITGTPSASQRARITDLFVDSDADQTIQVIEETSGTVILTLRVKANQATQQYTTRGGLESETVAKRLRVAASASNATRVTVFSKLIPN